MSMQQPKWNDVEAELDRRHLDALLIEAMAPVNSNEQHGSGVHERQRFLQKVADSAARDAHGLTRRLHTASWNVLKPGIRVALLKRHPDGNSVLIEFAPGSELPVHRHCWLEEGVILQGRLQLGALELGPGDYHCSPPGSRHARISSVTGGMAYLRGTSLGDPVGVIKELLGGLWPASGPSSCSVHAESIVWESLVPGISVMPLCAQDPRPSRFLRLEPLAHLGRRRDGAGVDGEREYLVVTGEVFFGDTLLRAGDYRWAPAQGGDEEMYSDIGACLFLR